MQEFLANHDRGGRAIGDFGETNGTASEGDAGVDAGPLVLSDGNLFWPHGVVWIEAWRPFAIFVPSNVTAVGAVVGLRAGRYLVVVLVRCGSDGPDLRLTSGGANVSVYGQRHHAVKRGDFGRTRRSAAHVVDRLLLEVGQNVECPGPGLL